MDGHDPKRYGVTEIDFSDLSDGIDALAEYHADPDQRSNICERILTVIEALASDTTTDQFRRAVLACMWFGDPVGPVRDAFSELAISCAGWSGAQAQIKNDKAVAAQHGRKGGRPKNADKAAKWAQESDGRKSRWGDLTAREIYEDIASDHGVKWTTVRDQISKHRNRKK